MKYQLIIDEFGGWNHFQALLTAVHRVARRHDVTIGAVAIAWVLEQPQMAGVIVGSRNARHLRDTLIAATLDLGDSDRQALRAVLDAHPPVPGDVYDIERVKGGRHSAIIKYDLNSRTGWEPGTG